MWEWGAIRDDVLGLALDGGSGALCATGLVDEEGASIAVADSEQRLLTLLTPPSLARDQ